ncbi:FAD-dependent monooxygenase [Streptomyces sp. SKN60]|uniref:FAD-dependent oxidoreductase n=1 Tax=Streptomyces sp. SKN60 TaxID=2855506 RepID=UPI002247FCB0|nr:FAD-dependent oxidoreductase [Streptomyces sp. SKN60]MCX2182074.1 FAD-dependent monooxygenase [Streptomyces sp. SKN60]
MVLSTTRSTLRNTDVLVVGGGIAGLSAAVFLAQQGVDCLLVERRAELSGHPRARGVHPRAMELMRAAGVEAELRGTPSARLLADNSGVIAATSLAGPELGVLDEKYVMDVGADIGLLSPTGWCLCHQGELEDVLRGRAERLGVALRFGTELVSFDQHGAGVTALLRDRATGADRTIEARYLVAADGAHSGIRDTLGIAFDGETLGHYLNIHFDADLTEPLAGRRFLMCYTAGEGVRGALVPLDNATEWLLHVAYDPATTEPESFTEERCAELVRAAAGVPGLRPRIRSVSPWDGAARTAGRFRDGRVFLVGDAAHVMPPSGGFGSSTGIQDAHNLAWKLAAVVAGWAGEALLDSYDEERRPICRATVEQAALRSKDRPRLTGGADGTGERPPVHPGIVEDAQVWLSWRYRSSAVTAWDEGVLPGYGVWSAENDGRPGGRAPHLRLRRGGAELSVLDLFGDRPVLLTGPDNRAWQEAARAVAHELDLPLTVHGIGAELIDVDDRWPELYGVTAQGAVLVRPDGVVAWRCADAPIFARDTLRAVLVRLLAR